MGLTSNQDAFDVNTLLHWVLDVPRPEHGPVTGTEARDAAARLAAAANRKVQAGLTPDNVRTLWPAPSAKRLVYTQEVDGG